MTTSGTVDSSPAKEVYVLQRNHAASTRLNLQHYMWHRELGYNIHPAVPIPEHAQIADVATGTSLWLLEVAEEHPSAQCDGFDIQLGQGPAAAWLPANIKLHRWDMMDPSGVPPGLQGHYDFVHIRLVILAVEDNVDPLISNLFSFLKPGGWLQWDEANFDRPLHAHAAGEDVPIGQSMAAMSKHMTDRAGQHWCRHMPEVLESHGFERAERFEAEPEKKTLKFATDLTIMVWDEVVATADEGPEKVMFSKLVDGVRQDAADGSAFAFAKAVTIARKPS